MEIGAWTQSDNYSGRIVRLSNAFVFKDPVYNYSHDFPFLWESIDLPVHYGSDVALTRQILLDAAKEILGDYPEQAREHWQNMVRKYLIENAHLEPNVGVKLTDNWIEFNLRYVVAYQKRRSTRTELFVKILDAIQQSQGKVTLASATFELVEAPELNVSVKK
ncbi:MAG: mechanosensitive ion channel family protein, partial [Saprospiraceae bacterium]|nr:mechanosensitive ion channel family protein [Saprospiraceae bacterium]